MRSSVKILLLSIGWISLTLGFIGVFVPMLPTTPFVILAALCFNRASPKLHQWLLSLPRVGPLLNDWQTKRIIPAKAKALASFMIVLGMYFMWVKAPKEILIIKVMVIIAMTSVIVYILKQKSHEP